jgi:ubiquinone/menaquinone biosynthesis C-methylase UbiE
VNPDADAEFRKGARALGYDPDNIWVGGYVAFEWEHGRHIYETRLSRLAGVRALEFGCNIGASAIVLASLGVEVTAIDVDERMLALARLNAARFGVESRIAFRHVAPGAALPFPGAAFDLVTCNSVLEYVDHRLLHDAQREIDRVLAPGGTLFVIGTSSRLWPREVHSRRWGVNYLPRSLDRLFTKSGSLQRGSWPWQLRRGFPGYENLDLADRGRAFLEARRRMGMRPSRLRVLAALHRVLCPLGLSPGLLLPSVSMTLRKRAAPLSA